MALPRDSFYITNTKPWLITEVEGHLIEFLVNTVATFSIITQRVGNLSNPKEYVTECQGFPGGSVVKEEFTY